MKLRNMRARLDANTKSSANLNFELPLAAGIWFLLSYLNLNH